MLLESLVLSSAPFNALVTLVACFNAEVIGCSGRNLKRTRMHVTARWLLQTKQHISRVRKTWQYRSPGDCQGIG
jgi:hypothetical protein